MADSLSKLKAHLQAGFSLNPSPVSFNGGYVAWRQRDLAYRWLRPVLLLCLSPVSRDGLPCIGLCRRRNGIIPALTEKSFVLSGRYPSTQNGFDQCSSC